MRRLWILPVALALASPVPAEPSQEQAKKELRVLVQEYTILEDAMDMEAQSKLMAEDRIWHGIGGRRTDNALWMKVQQESLDSFKEMFPNVKFYREVRDLHIRLVGDKAAVTSFTWAANRILPGDLSPEKVKLLGPDPVPIVLSLVWQKQKDGWKIVNSHVSPLYVTQ